MADRTFKITDPPMEGDDVEAWQKTVKEIGDSWGVEFPLKEDGVYGMATRSFTKMVVYGRGIPQNTLVHGVTPAIRTLMRHPNRRTQAMVQLADTKRLKDYRDNLREKFSGGEKVAAPISKILTMTWGWHPGVHDGIDLICGPNAPLYAVCDGRVIDVRSGGWWGKAPSGDVSKGDGIIQIECLTDEGPFKKGMHFGYGHAEKASVKVGQEVKAGKMLGRAGLAVAWHCHFMANWGRTNMGIGQTDPRPYVEYAIKND